MSLNWFHLRFTPLHPLAPPASMLYVVIVFSPPTGAHLFNIEFRGEGGETNTCRQHEFGLRTCFLQPSRICRPQPLLGWSAYIIKVVSHTQICFVPATMDSRGPCLSRLAGNRPARAAGKARRSGAGPVEGIYSTHGHHTANISRPYRAHIGPT